MKSFSRHFFVVAAIGLGLTATTSFGGNQELVERKAAELRSINEQVAKQAAPGGLKEGETITVKATLRVERVPEKTAVVRDLKIESVKVSAEPVAVSAPAVIHVAGSGKIRDGDVAEKSVTGGTPGVRQECLDVPTVKSTPPEIKVKPLEEGKSIPPPAVAEEKLPAAGTPGCHQESLNVPSVNEKRKE